jgi:hypothetical protein
VIPDLLAQLDRLVQLVLPEKPALLVRLGLLVLLAHKDQKAIREIQATQAHKVFRANRVSKVKLVNRASKVSKVK